MLEGDWIAPHKISEVVAAVAGQLRMARDLGSTEIHAVATAAIRQAANGDELVSAIREACGLEVVVLTGRAGGAAGVRRRGRARSGTCPTGSSAWSTSAAARRSWSSGTAPDTIRWCTSFALGSGDLADDCLRSDPPSERELSDARARVVRALKDLDAPHPTEAVAVGGSAASLQRAGRADARRRGVQADRWRCSAPRRRSTWPSGSRSTWSGCGCCRPGC